MELTTASYNEVLASNRQLMDQLRMLRLVTPGQHARWCANPGARQVDGLPEMLYSLYEDKIISETDLQELQPVVHAEAHLIDGVRRAWIVDEALRLYQPDAPIDPNETTTQPAPPGASWLPGCLFMLFLGTLFGQWWLAAICALLTSSVARYRTIALVAVIGLNIHFYA